jgi:aldose 1-epimerase
LSLRNEHTWTNRNLDAFQDDNNDILSHHLQIDASRVIALDDNAVPTGDFISVDSSPFDFRKGMKIGARWNDTIGLSGSGMISCPSLLSYFDLTYAGCQGYDHAWIYDRDETSKTATSLWSELSGIR